MNLKELIYFAGVLARNNKIFINLDFLIQSQKWDIDRIKNYQYSKLKGLLEHAYRNSEFYRIAFKQKKVYPRDIKSIKDLKKIPCLTKEELLKNAQRIQTKNSSEKLFYSETSGSTGQPLVFFRNKNWDAWHRASILRGYSWYNVKPWDRNGYLWGYNFNLTKRVKTKVLDCFQNRFRLFSYNDAEIDKFIKKLGKAVYLSGYSSMIYEIAKRINETEQKKPVFNLKMVKGTSEKIFDKYHDEVQIAFGKKIISEYGAAETGIIAFECPEGNMHINMETVIVEEEENQIIVTNLVSNSFPIIRYKLGDYIEIDDTVKCKCGREHYVIKEVTGRVGGIIQGFENQYPSLTLYYVFKNLAMDYNIILNYQVIQSLKGQLNVHIENKLKENEKRLLIQEFEKYFNNDIRLNIIDKIDLRSRNIKKKDFISEL